MRYFICIFSDMIEFIWNKKTLSVTHPWIVEKNWEFLWEISYEEFDSIIHTSTVLKGFFVFLYRMAISVDDRSCREILTMSNSISVSGKNYSFNRVRGHSSRQFFLWIREDSSLQILLGFGSFWMTRLISLVSSQ